MQSSGFHLNYFIDQKEHIATKLKCSVEFLCREPDKLRIFVNYALKTPEYECLSNFNRITYCCHFSAYARGLVLFRTYESRSGDAEFGH